MNAYRFDDLQIGLQQSFRVVLTPALLEQFLLITGDNSDIHVDCDAARARGFAHRVVWGMLTSAFYSTLVGVHLPGRFALLSSINIDFVNPAFPDDELQVEGEVSQRSDAMRAVTIQARITALQRDRIISKARILVKIDG